MSEESTIVNTKFVTEGQFYASLPHRKISLETCQKFGYKVNEAGDEFAYYLFDGNPVFQKIRHKGQHSFEARGQALKAPLFGHHLWGRHDRHRLRITEGEIDAMSLYELSPSTPVVSIGAGAGSAKFSVMHNLEFIESFENVEFVFDNDGPGREAARECAALLTPGKAYITKLRYKDPNEYLKHGKVNELKEDLGNSKEYRPDGVMHASEVNVTLSTDDISPYPFKSLTKKLLGRAQGDLTMVCSGTGMGKSTFVREMINYDTEAGESVGVMMLEESPSDTLNDLIGLRINQPVRRILASQKIQEIYPEDAPLVSTPLDVERYNEAKKFYDESNLYLYNHFGSLESDNLISKLNYMATGLGCTKIYLDHISIAVSGIESNNERKDIDILMTNLRSFVERTGVWLCCVTHLNRPDGKPFEEGGHITMKHLRGSGGIGQMSDEVIGLERNQQADDDADKNTVTVRVLKARRAGTTGEAGSLFYSSDDGRLKELETQTQGVVSPKIPSGTPDVLEV
jgi:twinkle protein